MGSDSRAQRVLALYALLVLAPVVVATAVRSQDGGRDAAAALGTAAGYVALALLALESALVARVTWVSRAFGTDALALFHRQMGCLAAAFVVAHAALLLARGVAPWRFLDPFGPTANGRCAAWAAWGALALVATAIPRRRLLLSYESWRTIHRAGALVVVAAALVHAFLAGEAARSAPLAVLLGAYALLVAALAVELRVRRSLALLRKPWVIVENRDVGGSTRLLALQPAGHAGLSFDAGQFAWLVTGRSPFSRAQHPLSLASSAARADGRVELAVKALGDWSRDVVPGLRAGTRVWLDGPFGAFTPERVAAPGFVLLAGGIGVAPMRSIVLTLRERRDPRPVILFHAAHDRQRAVFLAELEPLADGSSLRYVAVHEEPEAGAHVEGGCIDRALLARHLPAGFERWAFFVCGPPAMMDALERELAALGVPSDRIHSERFDLV